MQEEAGENEVPSEESEAQDEETDTDTDEENEIPQSKTTSDPWDRIMTETYETLQENFDDTVENYLQQNLGIQIQETENNAYEELRPDYSRELIRQYEDLVKIGSILKKDLVHRQVLATAKKKTSADKR